MSPMGPMSRAGDGSGSRRDRRSWPDAALAEQLLTLHRAPATPAYGPGFGSAPGSGRTGEGGVYAGGFGGTDADDPRTAELVRVLDAAARPLPVAPGREAAALAAFRQAQAERSVRRRRRTVPVKALVSGAAAVFALGGVAVAAQQGRLTDPFPGGSGAPHHSTDPGGSSGGRPSPSGPGSGHAVPGASGTVSPSPTLPGGLPAGTLRTPPSGVPTAPGAHGATGLKGLCETYLKPGTGGHLSERSMARLVQAAGGSARVGTYCRGVTSRSAEPSAVPTSVAPPTVSVAPPSATPSPTHPSDHPSHSAATALPVLPLPSHPDGTGRLPGH